MTDLTVRTARPLRAATNVPPVAVHAGLVPYGQAWDWQRDLVRRRGDDEIDDVLLTLEHPKVITEGKRADPANVLLSDDERAERGIERFEVDRGGDVTYHGPGQLVGYPILQLEASRGVVSYVRALEELLIGVCGTFGVDAAAVPGYTGVWVGNEKIAAIGVRVSSRGVTSHGFALNVDVDLSDFGAIIPCGISDKAVCSLQSRAVDVRVADVVPMVRSEFSRVFGCDVTESSAATLGLRDGSSS